MGQAPSAEIHGVKCNRCQRALPGNNWAFFDHYRDLGFLAFYDKTADNKRIVKYVRLMPNQDSWDYNCLACLKKHDETKFNSVKMAISGHAVLYTG